MIIDMIEKYYIKLKCGHYEQLILSNDLIKDKELYLNAAQSKECFECLLNKIITINYKEFKNNNYYNKLTKVPDSYNAITKTIKLYKN